MKPVLALALAAFVTLAAEAQPMKVGVISSATGPTAVVGIPQKNTAALLPRKIGDVSVEYFVFDDASDPTQSVALVKKLLTEEKVDAIIGPSGSPNAMGAIQFIAEAKTPLLAPVGTPAVVLPMDDQKRWVFKTTQNDSLISEALVGHMAKHGIKTVGFIGLADAYGESWYRTFVPMAVATPVKFALTRRQIHVQSVQHATLLDRDIGYVALTIFSEESAFDLRHAIDSLRAAGMKTLIFDLRGDPGGLLDQGVGVADLFLDPGQRIVSMRGRTADANRWFSDRTPQAWPEMPVAVLVDTNSASAAEIVAGALQDHDRAVLIGSATYGKGSAQNVFPVGRGAAVKLTTARWFTPSGRSIDRHRLNSDTATDTTGSRPRFKTDAGRVVLGGGGISPDVRLAAAAPTAPDTALEGALGKQIPQFKDALTDYALSLKASGTIKSPDFAVTPAMRAELLRRLRTRGVQLDSAVFERATPSVDRVLGYEVARYVFGQGAEFARRLHDDAQIARAVQLVRGATSPRDLLSRAADTARR